LTIRYPTARLLAIWGTAVFSGLGLGGMGALAAIPQPPRAIALGTVAAVILAAAFVAWGMRLAALARHPFRTLHARHSVTFGRGAMTDHGGASVTAKARSEFEFESLAAGQTSLRLQKFVIEPTALDPQELLTDWSYACRLGDDAPVPQPFLSTSRSLQLDVALKEPSLPGARYNVAEELSFESFLDVPARLVFQPSYPCAAQTVAINFEGPRPRHPRFKIDRGLGRCESGDLVVEESRLDFVWNRAEPGEQLEIEWDWDPETFPKPASETERLIAAARKRQDELQKLLASQIAADTIEGEGALEIIRAAHEASGAPPSLPGDAGFADDTADEHPLIRAARQREKLYKGDK
jgi:hypothetical protein